MLIDDNLKNRFEKKIMPEPNSGCWLWMASINKGYGHLRYKNKIVLAHRLAYELYKGPIPKNTCVCHKCDTPSCVNPDHLFLGSKKDNTNDMLSKNRQARGIKQRASKLTNQQVLDICASPLGKRKIAKLYNVDHSAIHKIRTGRNWNWLTNIKKI